MKPFRAMKRYGAKIAAPVAAGVALTVGTMGSALAALDPAVGTGITAAQTDLIELYGLMTVAGLAVFVAAVVYRKFKLR